MNPRERILAFTCIAILLVGGGGVGGYMLIYSPLQEKKAAAAKLQGEVDDLDQKAFVMMKAAPQVAEVKRQSLPPDLNIAKAQYKLLLERLLLQARIADYKIPPERVSIGRPPVTPEIAPKKPAYTTITFNVDINKANLWQVVDFLYGYYQLDLLHQITDLKITRENRVNESRGGLKVGITIEAIILDDATPRSSMFPVTSAVAAVAGYPGLQAVVAKPEMVRRLTTISTTPVLATHSRDYSLIPFRDMFYGQIPKPEKEAPSFAISKPSDVVMKRDDKPHEVRVRLSGDGATGATIAATASGSLLPEGELKVDQETHTITIPAIDSDAGDYASSTVSIVATSSKGKTQKSSFSVSIDKPPPKIEKKDDIASVIRLIIVSTDSDGTATAIIKDHANPFKYEIAATAKGITVKKFYQATKFRWGDEEYKHPPGVLAISDEGVTLTKRTFNVIAIEENAIIVSEIGQHESGKSDGKLPGKGGFRPPAGPAKQGHGDPMAAVGSNLTVAIAPPVYYRWSSGKSLKELVKLTPEETKKILRQVADSGPAASTALSAAGH